MRKKELHLLAAVIIFIIARMMLRNCADMGITAAGASTLALFIATVYLWLTYDSGWVSLLSIGLLGFTGICSTETILANSFGNTITVTVIAVMILCVALEENGVTATLANRFITGNAVKKRPYVFFFMFFLANLFFGWFMESTPVIIIFAALAKNILESLGYTSRDKFSKALYLGILWMSCVSLGATPIGHPLIMMLLNAVNEITGKNISWLRYMTVGIPLSLVTLVIAILIIRFFIRPDCAKFERYDVEKRRAELQPLSAKGKLSLLVYVMLIFWWLIPDIFGGLAPEFAAFAGSIGVPLSSLIAAGILCALKVGGEPVLHYSSALKKINWTTVYFIACIFLYASVLNMPAGGISVFFKNLIMPLSAGMSLEMLVAIFLLLVLILTNFVSNGVTGTLGILACAPVILAMSDVASVTAYGVLVAMLCSMGVATPGGCAFVAIAQKDGYVNGGDTLKYGMLFILFVYIAVMLIFWPFARQILS